jgi:hypothetical protein
MGNINHSEILVALPDPVAFRVREAGHELLICGPIRRLFAQWYLNGADRALARMTGHA